MSVEKMFFVNISGPIDELDSFVLKGIIPYEIQLVKAFTILDTVKGLYPFEEENPYEPILRQMDGIGIKSNPQGKEIDLVNKNIDIEGVKKRLDQFEDEIGDIRDERNILKEVLKKKESIRKQILPMQNLDIEIDELFRFEHMKFRFGKMPVESFGKLQDYVDKVEIIVHEVYEEAGEIFLVYFTPQVHKETIDSLFASLYFTRIRISDEVKGYPKDALETIEEDIREVNAKIESMDKSIEEYFGDQRQELEELYLFLEELDQVFDVRNYAAHSQEAFFLTGWISATYLDAFDLEMSGMHAYSHLIEEDDAVQKAKPPTKLKNNRFFKPFESLVSMYGMPSYNEIDPTIFVGITYLLMFGLMFGDIGQGLIIGLGGLYLYIKKGVKAGILGCYIGVVSMITGVLYGSVFANEHLLRDAFPNVPFLNAMDSKNMILVLGGTIAFGVVIMIMAMVFNMVNAARNKNFGRLIFDRNGVVGLVFYFAVLALLGMVVLGGQSFENVVMVPIVLIVVSLIMILLSHPLQNYVNKKRKIFPDEKVGFFIESTFEVIEVVLAVLSNTISFMRIGAFAMNHVGFSLAFEILSDMVSSSGNTIGGVLVMIVGNLVIIVLEGLIVGIQCLRLEYYELFSRFFDGDGIKFEPFSVRNKVKKLNA